MAAELAESYELDPFAALLLVSRGVTADNADEFLYPQCDIDPFLLPDMEKAANRIRKAIESFEKIAVFSNAMHTMEATECFLAMIRSCFRSASAKTSSRAETPWSAHAIK